MTTETPTLEELWDHVDAAEGDEGCDYADVGDELRGRWRHGTEHLAIFKRISDGTHWGVFYRRALSGDCNEFRDGEANPPVQVYRKEVVKVTWSTKP